MKIQGISHITFRCQDIEKSSKLFRELFGAKEIYASDDKTFSISREKFFLINDLWIALMEGEPLPKTYNHIAFKVDTKDLPAFEEKIKALNLTILPGRTRSEEEGQSLYFYDYDNHLFELHTGDLNTRLNFYNKN